MAGSWDQAAFDKALAQKYSIMQQQANAQTVEAAARAQYASQQAQQVAPLAQSTIGLEKSASGLNNANAFEAGQRGKYVAPRANAEINANNASAFLNLQQGSVVPERAAADYATSTSGANLNNVQSAAVVAKNRPQDGSPLPAIQWPALMSPTYASAPADAPPPPRIIGGAPASMPDTNPNIRRPPRTTSLLDDTSSFLKPSTLMGGGMKPYKRGVTSVPGKGEGDKMPSMLEPKEAVLNKHAADMLGRKKIAQLNKAGNEKRAQQDNQRASKLAQTLKLAGMI